MTAELTPPAGPVLPLAASPPPPRRARQLIPTNVPRRRELVAAGAVALVLGHLLLAQLTIAAAVLFALTGRVTRWRAWWLLGPAVAGLAWVLVLGPDRALAGFAAAPASLLAHLGAGRAGRDGAPPDPLPGIAGLLARQLPVALPLAAAEAAFWSWLARLHTDEWAVPSPRRGALAALRTAVTARSVRAGAVVTRNGCALGVVPGTGAVAELRWAEIARGALVTGADEREVTLTCLQLVHAALRRRKSLIVLADGRDTAIAGALAAACRATGTPLLPPDRRDTSARDGSGRDASGPGGPQRSMAPSGSAAPSGDPAAAPDAVSASLLWGRDRAGFHPPGQRPGPGRRGGTALVESGLAGAESSETGPAETGPADLTTVLMARAAVLLDTGLPELADRACADVAALAAHLRAIGVDGDALVWVPRAELLPGPALAALLRDGGTAGLPVLASTTSPGAATELSGRAGALLIRRVADEDLAGVLAARSGRRLLPPAVAAALGGQARRGGADGSPAAPRPPADPAMATAWPDAAAAWPGVKPGQPGPAAAGPGSEAAGLVPGPVIPARLLLTLGEGEFVLAVHTPRPRYVAPGRLVPARLPPATASASPTSPGTPGTPGTPVGRDGQAAAAGAAS